MNDIVLFDDADKGFDLFEEIELFNFEDDIVTVDSEIVEEYDPELIQKSVQEFYEIFNREEEELSIASSTILLHQHLNNSGYKTNLSIEDHHAWVKASTHISALKEALIDRVESLLDDMCYVEHAWNTDSFTVHSVLTKTIENTLEVQINFKTI
ncbi:hypothetical protein [Curvivirga aplysinae]|uniref:hypothetical protein n=1 Tax=Curvivirga aplysinae TaxID=2529852 RepID=UPI0012BBBDDA|nr:hypothetical protein [Curvivirga aplysinae]MTI09573.1 hypothetical protein [Curvivirga aplysinae]